MPKKPPSKNSKALLVPSYRLKLLPAAPKEWDKLDGGVQLQFLKVLKRSPGGTAHPEGGARRHARLLLFNCVN